MNYAIVKNNKVVNVIVADSLEIAEAAASQIDCVAVQSDTAAIGNIYEDGQWIIDEQLTAVELEASRQAAKTLKLKEAENAYLALVASIPGVLPGDNSEIITAKLETTTELTDVQKVMLGLKLLNGIREVELAGGSWYGLPSTPHVIE